MPTAEEGPGRRLTVPALVLLAAGARVVAAAGLAVIPRDGTVLVPLSRAVAAGDLRAAFESSQHPLLPLLGGLLGGSELAVVLLAVVAGALGTPALVSIGERLHSRRLGVLAALLYAVAPALVRYESAPYAEALSVPLALWSLERALASAHRTGAALPAGLLAGLAYLARPGPLLLAAVLPPALLLRRRWAAAALLLFGFAASGGLYAGALTAEAGRLTLSRKKPAAPFLSAGADFDRRQRERAARTGLSRPGAAAAATETLRTLGEALSWGLLFLALPGGFLLLRRGPGRAAALTLLALLLADLLLRFRLLELTGYLGRRHLATAAALALPFAAGGLLLAGRRRALLAAGILSAALLLFAVRPRDGEKAPLREAGRWLLATEGPGARVATLRTPRIPYYARGTDVRLGRIDLGAGREALRAFLRARADWLAIVPGRLDARSRAALLSAAGPPVRSFGEGNRRVLLLRVR